MEILAVDDQASQLEALRLVLEGWTKGGQGLTLLADGEEAKHFLEGRTVDLVVTDIDMPRMSGIELIEWIKSRAYLKNTRIIVVSGGLSSDQLLRLQELEVNRILTKPYRLEDLETFLLEMFGMPLA